MDAAAPTPEPEQVAQTTPPASAPRPSAPGQARLTSAPRTPLTWSLWLLGALMLAQWAYSQYQFNRVQDELTRRLMASDGSVKAQDALIKQQQELLASLSERAALMEEQLAEAQTQQISLASMYQELSHSRDERVLAEVEQAVASAAQQLQLAGNVEAALIALQTADSRLMRAALPQLTGVRKLINRDIEQLKALPLADVPGISMKLEHLVGLADGLPLAFEQRARAEPQVKRRLGLAPENWWQALGRELWGELRQLVRVERVEQGAAAETALLSPSQVFFLRENLKLRLLTARLALLQRDSQSYRNDLRQARHWLERYFDTRERSVASAIAMLKQMAAADLSLQLPTLNETLGSIRSQKLGREQGK